MQLAGGVGVAALTFEYALRPNYAFGAGPGGTSWLGSGTVPEQIHLTWGADPSTASPCRGPRRARDHARRSR